MVEQTLEKTEPYMPITIVDRTDLATDISRGFSRGNYANAYETRSIARMLLNIMGESAAYKNAAVLGFFSSFELSELRQFHGVEARDLFQEAYFSEAGQMCVKAGYLDEISQATWETEY